MGRQIIGCLAIVELLLIGYFMVLMPVSRNDVHYINKHFTVLGIVR